LKDSLEKIHQAYLQKIKQRDSHSGQIKN